MALRRPNHLCFDQGSPGVIDTGDLDGQKACVTACLHIGDVVIEEQHTVRPNAQPGADMLEDLTVC